VIGVAEAETKVVTGAERSEVEAALQAARSAVERARSFLGGRLPAAPPSP
jgi:hypothetical protein